MSSCDKRSLERSSSISSSFTSLSMDSSRLSMESNTSMDSTSRLSSAHPVLCSLLNSPMVHPTTSPCSPCLPTAHPLVVTPRRQQSQEVGVGTRGQE